MLSVKAIIIIFQVAICTTIGVIGNPNVNYLSYALNWGVAYDLPNETWVLAHANGFKAGEDTSDDTKPDDMAAEAKTKRMFRRDLYKKLELAINRYVFLHTFSTI